MKEKLIIIIGFFICNHLSFSQSVDLTTYLPKNHDVSGNVDYTEYMQSGLNENNVVTFPNFPIMINANGLSVRDNQTLNFPENSCLIMKPNTNERYGLLNIKNVQNVMINNPNLEGDKEKHIGVKGEWGMGINILSSKNIEINNPNISKFWGDGIYIGEIHYTERNNYKLDDYSSKEVVIKGGIIDDNRRNGISVISVKGLLIENIVVQNTSGTLPMAGIDIEPNNNSQFLEGIVIRGVTTKNNAEIGIKYVVSNFLGKREKNVSITIENCKIIGSKMGLYLGGARGADKGKIQEKFEGKITVKNCKSYSNEIPIENGSIQRYNPEISIDSFSVYDKKGERNVKEEKRVEAKSRYLQSYTKKR